jgi:hypothetical protein
MGKLIPTKVTELENILNNNSTLSNIFWGTGGRNFLAFLGDNFEISDNQAMYSYTPSSQYLDCYAAYIFYQPYQDPNMDQPQWTTGIYKATGLFNNVIDGIAGLSATESNTDYARGIIAQARAGRAWTYLVGGLCYGPMWNPNGANDIKSIPYRKDADPSIPNPDRATLSEIFDLALEDLEYALKYAPDNAGNPCRANKAAVNAILSEYYMYKRDWTNMLYYAEEAWRLSLAQKGSVSNMIYDYNTWSYNVVGTPVTPAPNAPDNEVNWSINAPVGFNQSNSIENLFHRIAPMATTYVAWAADATYPSEEYVNLFSSNDRRKQLFMLRGNGFSGSGVSDGIRICNYRDTKLNLGTTESRNEAIAFPVLLLTRAEAYLRTGQRDKALTDLNTLRYYRYERTSTVSPGGNQETDLPNGSSMTDDQLMLEILKERRIEQPIASFQRILDLKRFVYDTGKPWCKTSITHTVMGKTYTASIDSDFFTLSVNNNTIKFNPHWGLTEYTAIWDPTK